MEKQKPTYEELESKIRKLEYQLAKYKTNYDLDFKFENISAFEIQKKGVGYFRTDPKGKLIDADENFADIFGYLSSVEMLKSIKNISYDLYASPEIREKFLKQEFDYRSIFQFTADYKKKSGQIFKAQVHVKKTIENDNLFYDGILEDMTFLKAKQQKLEENEQLYKKLFETAQEGIWVIDENNKTTIVNKSMANMLEYEVDEMIGKTLFNFMDKEGQKIALKNIERRQQGIAEQHDFEFITKNGKRIYTTIETAQITDNDGNYKGAIAGIIDISDRRKYEDNLKQINKKLSESNRNLKKNQLLLKYTIKKSEESNQLKDAFLRNISHEIRTPLNSVIGFSQILERNIDNVEKQKQYIAKIIANGVNLKSIVDDILEMANIQTGNVRITETENNLYQFLLWVDHQKHNFTKNNNTDFIIQNSESNKNIYFTTDIFKLRTILIKIIDNGLKFTSDGYVKLSTVKNKGTIQFIIEDTGIGISEVQQKSIFNIFRQGSENLSKKYSGIGIGLNICKHYIELLDGKISFESELGKGSIFYIEIPYNKNNNTEPDKKCLFEKINGAHIILLSKQESTFFYLLNQLKDYSPNYIFTSNIYEFKDALESENNPIVLFDINCFDFFDKEYLSELNSKLSIVAYISNFDLYQQIKATENYFSGYLKNTHDKNKILNQICSHL